jgi:hypothetical protein
MIGDPAQDSARAFFDFLGARVERIPEVPGQPRADFLVTWPSEACVVEVKGKEENEEYSRCLRGTGTTVRSEVLGRTNPISRQIREAIGQVRATPAPEAAFRLLVLVAADDAPEVHSAQFKATLYGTVDIVAPDPGGQAVARPCFYFTYCEFYDASDVDAAVILVGASSFLCLNEFSPRLGAFRSSSLYRVHASCAAVLDPADMETSGRAYSAKEDLPRGNPEAMLQFITQKYGLPVAHNVTFTHHAAAAIVGYPYCP